MALWGLGENRLQTVSAGLSPVSWSSQGGLKLQRSYARSLCPPEAHSQTNEGWERCKQAV